ncbi:DUF2087 domain-containing protein [Paenibacillus gansuensis]|uniref:DUF2087 domain-containing protein n=1 Tax=Paenibacillus gansuensis TaxID=306542 RepID=A0ABW5PJ13_9BACL
MDLTERFWNASLTEMKQGYVQEQHHYICLLCGQSYEDGIIYPENGVLYQASKYIRVHVEKAHQSVFHYLIQMDKKLTGLTEHQNALLRQFYEGKSDAEVQKELGIGSASTIRNHRFALKEKERQSKVFLALMDLLKDNDRHAPAMVDVPKTARMVDERYNLTRKEYDEAIAKYFPQGTDGPLTTFHIQEKYKLVVLRELASKFEPGRTYTEKEINEVLKARYADFVTLRRYLIEYGFMDRKPDGSEYWIQA